MLTGITGSIERVPRWEPTAEELDRAHLMMKTMGVDVPTSPHWHTMSQGERGRTLIARALMTEPRCCSSTSRAPASTWPRASR